MKIHVFVVALVLFCGEFKLIKTHPRRISFLPEYTNPPSVAEQFTYELMSVIVASQDHLSGNNFVVSPIEIWAMFLTMAEQAKEQNKTMTLRQLLQALHLEDGTNLQQESLQYYKFVKIFGEDFRVKELCFEFEKETVTNNLENKSGIFEYVNYGDRIDFKCQLNTPEVLETTVSETNSSDVNAPKAVDIADDVFDESIQWKIDKKVELLTLSTAYSMKHIYNSTHLLLDGESGEDFTIEYLQQNGKFPQITNQELDARVLMLPYDEHKRLSLLLIIPTNNILGGIFTRLQRVTVKTIMQQLNENPEVNQEGVAIPTIKIASIVNLKSVIKQMGIQKNPFDIRGTDYEILHKAEFELKQPDEIPTEANTADVISERFAFLIIERHTYTIVLAGQVENPIQN